MIKTLHKVVRNTLIAATLGVVSLPASAQSFDPNAREIIIAPYLWGSAIDGTSTVGILPPLDIDASFGDILSNLNFAMSLHTEFKGGPWVFVIDPTFISLEMEAGPGGGGPSVDMEVDIWIVEAWAGYQFHDNWEAIGGARYQDQDLSVSAGLPSPPFPGSISAGASWTDWFIGFRFNSPIGDKWHFTWRADFGVAGDSDSAWNTQAFFHRRFGQSMALNLGYRYLTNDFSDPGNYGWDVNQSGPVLGYTWAF